ncbi:MULTISPECIES: hypothetical protein [unclassified Desulfovibrio]|uniref:hypothetical protein n=1 Tax=unclassified Desulfovibrio TaxID=2593640 RepID=UPI0013EDA0DB|nr:MULTISPECIES: hypothetical protein [unclassified Desulfovibrio]
MPDMNLHPADLLTRAAARIRWQQRLLCGLPPDGDLDMGAQDAQGLYYTLEDIFEDITAALRNMEESQKA